MRKRGILFRLSLFRVFVMLFWYSSLFSDFGFRIFIIALAFVWRFEFGILEWLLSPLLYL